MSTQLLKDICCPHCGEPARTQMWTSIRAEDGSLRGQVLDETLFDWECPHCGYQAVLVYPCLYHDPAHKFMVYLVPGGDERSLKNVDVAERFPQLSGLRKRAVGTVMELKEKILIFESGLSDTAVEVVKAGLRGLVEKKAGGMVEQAVFCFSDPENARLGFQFYLEGQDEPVKRATKMSTYETSLEIVNTCCEPLGDSFTHVDLGLAARILEAYQRENNEESGPAEPGAGPMEGTD